MLRVMTREAWIAGLLCACLAGCANTPAKKNEIAQLGEAHLVQVVTPALEAPTFFQAAVKRGIVGGALPVAIAESDAKATLAPPVIPDAGRLLAQKLKTKVEREVPWWPRLGDAGGPMPANYVYPGGPWLRVEIASFYIAATPVKTLHIDAKVSLRRAGDRGDPYWSKFKTYSGLVHGGEKLDEDRLAKDGALLAREIDHATAWLADAIAAELASTR